MILHIPHAQRQISATYREYFVLDDEALEREQLRLVDAYTDELFQFKDATRIVFPYSRLLVDVERFPDDANEPMSKVGMGAIYVLTIDGRPLKRLLTGQERLELMTVYNDHHNAVTDAVRRELATNQQSMIVDCHSFPSEPLPCDVNQKRPRPDFCIGVDEVHTPTKLVEGLIQRIQGWGYSVAINESYEGTLVPIDYFQSDARVKSVMIEVNRALYMNEGNGKLNAEFDAIKLQLRELLSAVKRFNGNLQ